MDGWTNTKIQNDYSEERKKKRKANDYKHIMERKKEWQMNTNRLWTERKKERKF